MSHEGSIIFYDGECGLCNGFVRFTLARDRSRRFRFAPIDGKTWHECPQTESVDDLNSVYLLQGDRLFKRTSAVTRILFGMGVFWQTMAAILWVIPLPIRNLGYRCVAALRYRLAGRVDACSIPAHESKDMLLP